MVTGVLEMSSFQFNFNFKKGNEKFGSTASEEITNTNNLSSEKDERIKLVSFQEWKVPIETISKSKSNFESEPVEGFPSLIKRKYCNVLSDLDTETAKEDVDFPIDAVDILKITKESDLEPSKYEGGLKTWECSIDLLNLLEGEQTDSVCRSVLEIGCGSGLPGIHCYKKYLSVNGGDDGLFVFQDFNQSVLERVTLPNIILNTQQKMTKLIKSVKFYFGDWIGLPSSTIPPNSFNLILTSETIYREESYQPLLDIFTYALSHEPEARVLLAAKDYYFGLGGSVEQFCKFVRLQGGWDIKILRKFCEGVPRSIISMSRAEPVN